MKRVQAVRLRGGIGYFQYLALGFGTMVGSAWVILLGSWLSKSGPGGTILGFALGTLVMMIVGACYAELAAQIPEAGSEFIYARRIYGRNAAFVVGWFLVLYVVSVTVFEALALAWIVELMGAGLHWEPLYQAFGESIDLLSLMIGGGVAIALFAINYRGTDLAVSAHSTFTLAFLVVALIVLALIASHGNVRNASPAFESLDGSSWWIGAGTVFAFCAYGLNGFQAIPQAIEERSNSLGLHAIAGLIVLSIAAGGLFYCVIAFGVAVAAPWQELAATPIPMKTAAERLPYGAVLVASLLIATAVSLIKTWNGIVMIGARVLVAMARDGLLPARFATVHPRHGTPAFALGLVAILNIGGLFLGKGAIGAIADMCAMVLTLTYVLCCVTVLRLRQRGNASSFRVPGGTVTIVLGTIGAAIMAAVAFIGPFFRNPGTIPLEWILLAAWGLIGGLIWKAVVSRSLRSN